MSGVEDFLPPGSCGDCVMCCQWLDIDTEGLNKKAGTLCHHCTSTGCGIYETRPQLCRGFFCGWRLIPGLGDAWRPDRSGVMILSVEKDVPAEYTGAITGYNFVILGGEAAVLWPPLAEYVGLLMSRKVAVYLSANTPKTLLNPYLKEPASARDIPGVRALLLHVYGLHKEAGKLGYPGFEGAPR